MLRIVAFFRFLEPGSHCVFIIDNNVDIVSCTD